MISRRLGLVVCSLTVAGILVGCRSTGEGALLGALAGAGVGAVVSKDENRAEGALAGAVAGAIIGAAVGNYRERHAEDRQTTVARYEYRQGQGSLVNLEEAYVNPASARAGEQVSLVLKYAILTPSPRDSARVKETRRVLYQGRVLVDETRDVELGTGGGTFVTELPVTIPGKADAGRYQYEGTVEYSGTARTGTDSFQVTAS